MNMRIRAGWLSVLLAWSGAAIAAPEAQDILKASDKARGGGLPGIIWEIKLASRTGSKTDETQRLRVKAVDTSSVAETQEPARFKGTRLLQVGRNMWLTKPGLSKPIPISPRQRMSGQASNGDIAATNYADDYDPLVAETAMLDGEECYVLELKAKHKRATYDRIKYWISVKRRVGMKAEFNSISGKLLKTAWFEYGNTITHNGNPIPFVSKMTIRDALVDSETTMEFSSVTVNNVSASEFDLGQMP